MKDPSIEELLLTLVIKGSTHDKMYYSRRELSKIVKENFGIEWYKVLQKLWKENYLHYNAWGIINPTRKAYIDYRF